MPPPRRLFLVLLSIPALFLFLLFLYSRSSISNLFSTTPHSSKLPDEIFGLLHFVTSPDEAGRFVIAPGDPVLDGTPSVILENIVAPEKPIGMAWYALGSISKAGVHPHWNGPTMLASGWEQMLEVLRQEHPLVVFSKSYCPYSKRAKRLLEIYDISPAPKIIEVDLRGATVGLGFTLADYRVLQADSSHIKTLLTRLTHQSTFPNVILHGRSLGGSDDLVRLHEEDRLRQVLEEGGVKVGWTGEGNQGIF